MEGDQKAERIPRWTKISEFELGKRIRTIGLEKDAQGDILFYHDLDNDVVRFFDTTYKSLRNAITNQKVEKNKSYTVTYAPGPKGYKEWKFDPRV